MKNLIPQQTQQDFTQIYSSLSRDQLKVVNYIFDEIFLKIGFVPDIANSHEIEKQLQTIFREKTAIFPDYEKVVLKRSLVAKLALNLPTIIEKMNLPKSIIDLYPDAFRRVAVKLKNTTDGPQGLTDDFLLKDIRFVLGLTVPCGALIVDMNSKLRFGNLIYTVLRTGDLSAIFRYVRARGHGFWFRIHLDIMYLTEFNEKGWDECFMRIAELLESRKNICGMVGTSWFYDPQLLEISSHLAYLHRRQVERGAFVLSHRTSNFDIESAIKKSKTRRRLYEEGKYFPKVYSIVWPRKELISWAQKVQHEN